MTSKHWGVAAVGLIVLIAACQKEQQFSASDEAEVRGMFDSTVTWFKAKNFDKWAAQFEDTAYLQPANAKTVVGRPALLAWAGAFPPIEELSFPNVQAAGSGNMAYGSSNYVLKLKDAPIDSGKQLGVFHRGTDGHWKISAISFSSDLPLPTTASAPPTKAPPGSKK